MEQAAVPLLQIFWKNFLPFRFLREEQHLNVIFFPWRCIRYILKRIPFIKKYFINKAPIKSDIHLYISWNDDPNMTMQKASEMVMDLINKNINFEELKL